MPIEQDAYKQAANVLAGWNRTLLLTHERPDGDALGALLALRQVIETEGRTADAYLYDEIPHRYAFLPQTAELKYWSPDELAEMDQRYDGIVILDTSSWTQLDSATGYLQASHLPRIVVDHHATADHLAGAGGALIELSDATAASACTLLYEWCRAANWNVNRDTAVNLFAGIATDTGWFRFSNTDARSLRAASDLLNAGVHADLLYASIYESHRAERIRLKCQLLSTLELHENNKLATTRLTPEMFERSGANMADTEDLVNEPMSIDTVLAAVLLTDTGNGTIRVNLRSKSPELCGKDVDVSAVARSLGGGGHRRAAGARVAGKLDAVYRQVMDAMTAAVR